MSESFDLSRFVAECEDAARSDVPQRAVRDVVARAVRAPALLLAALGEPRRAELQTLHHTPQLTILNVVWAPRMTRTAHEHRMWAVIGVYTGGEDNIFWRRVAGASHGAIEARGAQALRAGDAVTLGQDVIHSVTNPLPRFTAALHVYGGDFFAATRSEWDPETLTEQPYDGQVAMRRFEEENRRFELVAKVAER